MLRQSKLQAIALFHLDAEVMVAERAGKMQTDGAFLWQRTIMPVLGAFSTH